MFCPSCEVVVLNGILCHEHGCPDSHIGALRECDWCGSEFHPEERGHRFCDEDCQLSALGEFYHDT